MKVTGFSANSKEVSAAKESALNLATRAADWVASRLPESSGTRLPTLPELRLIAHRGAWRHICANTFRAFDRAREVGVWGLEFDVRFTKDDIPVVHHDETLLRTFGRPLAIESMTLSTLRHEASDVPTLAETVAEYGKSMHLMVEIKDPRDSLTDLRLKRILQPFEETSLRPEENYHFMSFDMQTLEAFNKRLGLSRRSLVSIATTNTVEISDYTLTNGLKGIYLPLVDDECRDHPTSSCNSPMLRSRLCQFKKIIRTNGRGASIGSSPMRLLRPSPG